jgi:LuxR family transcriptional regulator, maltose regulon positive regulatory protein
MARTTAQLDGATLVPSERDASPITVDTPAWYTWLEHATTFAFRSSSGRFTARKERQARGGGYWKAYRTSHGTLHRAYLGKSQDLTLERLNRAAATLAAASAPLTAIPANVLATKLFVPPARANLVARPRLTERLTAGLHRKLTLISAPAGFGKTTLVSEWVAGCGHPAAWLSLDEEDSDPVRFLTYLVAAVQTIAPTLGAGVMGALQSPQPPSIKSILATLLNEITALPDTFVLVLDDYHVIDAKPIDDALAFLVAHLPPGMHLVIATRADPSLALARLRARSQLTELRAADLRFSPAEAAAFLNAAMGLSLSPEDIAALEDRTEGWIAGLQLAALSIQGQHDATRFIQSFTGSHHFVLDYLVEEVLEQQPARVQTFLLRTSILDRLCSPLCDAVLQDPAASGQATLEYLEHANLFIVPLDNERRWYRYHDLFADLLRQRLHQSSTSFPAEEGRGVDALHRRASQWYEDHGLELEAFQHAAAANDVERAARLIEGEGIPRHFRSVVTTILDWLHSLPRTVLNGRPSLWWRYASLLLVNGHTTGVEEKLQAAEAALQGTEADDQTRNLVGQIAATRATLALTRYDVETMLAQSRRALAYLHPNNLSTRANANWTLGVVYQHQGDRAAAEHAFTESIALSQACGDSFTTIMAMIGLADIQIAENQLYMAAETFQHVLHLLGDPPLPVASSAHLSLARIFYEWNNLDAAEQHGRQGLHLARQFDRALDRFVIGEVFLARLKLAQGDVAGAAALLAQTSQSTRERNFVQRVPEVAAVQVLTLLRQGNLAVAAQLAESHDLPISQARVHLARGDPPAALALLDPVLQQMEAKGWQDERLKVMVLQAIAHHAHGATDAAVQVVGDALALAEPGGFIRLFVDEGPPMARLLREAAARGIVPHYTRQVLAAFSPVGASQPLPGRADAPHASLSEPLSERELEVLQHIAEGLSNQEIASRLYLSLHTVKVHSRNIYGKLGVHNRTQAVARARSLNMLPAV